MAHLIRQRVTYYVDADGRKVPKGTRGAEKRSEFSPKWYGAGIPGQGSKRFPLATDKRTALKLLNDMVTKAERGEALIAEPSADVALEPLVKEFEAFVGRKSGDKHRDAVVADVRRVLKGCGLHVLADLHKPDLAESVESYVFGLAKDADSGISLTTAAYIGKHARSFTRWLWRKRGKLTFDPLAGMDLPSQGEGTKRRAFSTEELAQLIETTDASTREFRYLKGPERSLLYLVAVSTGYRAGELAALKPANFELDADVPLARLRGSQTKNGKDAAQPLPPAVVHRLRTYLADRPASREVWPGTWATRAADMLKADLKAAGIPLAVDDEAALFHSLRHTYTSMLARTAPVKVTQDLARHSTPMLTIGTYSHASLTEKAEAVAALPLPGKSILPSEGCSFGHLSRTELEATAGAMLLGMLAMASQFTPPLTLASRPTGDSGGLPETPKGKRAAASARKKTPEKQGF